MPELYYLISVKYNEEKKRILLQYSNSSSEIISRVEKFFPWFLVEKKYLRILSKLRKQFNPRKIVLELKTNSIKVMSSDLSTLKKFIKLFELSTSKRIFLMEPERQFLALNNFSYFDCFSFIEGNPVKINGFHFPNTFIPEIDSRISDWLLELKKNNKNISGFLNDIVLSNLLAIPLNDLNNDSFFVVEKFFELIAFKNDFPFYLKSSSKKEINSTKVKGFYSDLTEVDFSIALLESLIQENINFSFNCSCCSLENDVSLVKVKFLKDCFYFQSLNNAFAKEFHKTSPGKAYREKRLGEFSLQAIPVGPFNRNDITIIPLADAKQLLEENSIEFLNFEEKIVFCKNGFLREELRFLLNSFIELNSFLNKKQLAYLKKYNLLAGKILNENAELLYFKELRNYFLKLISLIAGHLQDINSKFFFKETAQAISIMQCKLLNEFKEFVKNNSGEIVYSGKQKAFINCKAPLTITKKFSKEKQLRFSLKQWPNFLF